MGDRGAETNTPSLSFKQEIEPPRQPRLKKVLISEIRLSRPDTCREIMDPGAPRS